MLGDVLERLEAVLDEARAAGAGRARAAYSPRSGPGASRPLRAAFSLPGMPASAMPQWSRMRRANCALLGGDHQGLLRLRDKSTQVLERQYGTYRQPAVRVGSDPFAAHVVERAPEPAHERPPGPPSSASTMPSRVRSQQGGDLVLGPAERHRPQQHRHLPAVHDHRPEPAERRQLAVPGGGRAGPRARVRAPAGLEVLAHPVAENAVEVQREDVRPAPRDRAPSPWPVHPIIDRADSSSARRGRRASQRPAGPGTMSPGGHRPTAPTIPRTSRRPGLLRGLLDPRALRGGMGPGHGARRPPGPACPMSTGGGCWTWDAAPDSWRATSPRAERRKWWASTCRSECWSWREPMRDHPRVTYVHGALEEAEAFLPSRFDLAVSSLVFHYVEELSGAGRAHRRVARAGRRARLLDRAPISRHNYPVTAGCSTRPAGGPAGRSSRYSDERAAETETWFVSGVRKVHARCPRWSTACSMPVSPSSAWWSPSRASDGSRITRSTPTSGAAPCSSWSARARPDRPQEHGLPNRAAWSGAAGPSGDLLQRGQQLRRPGPNLRILISHALSRKSVLGNTGHPYSVRRNVCATGA